MKNPRITVEDELWRKIRATASAQGTSISHVVEQALTNYVSPNVKATASNATNTVSNLSYSTFHPVPKPEAKKRRVKPDLTTNMTEDEVTGW